MRYWLLKTEPTTFSFTELERAPERTQGWDGVRNYQARNSMRDDFARGDKVFVYHSSTAEPAIIGTAVVVRAAYPDLSALDPENDHFDPKSLALGKSRWVMVDIQAEKRLAAPITLKELRQHPDLAGMALLKPGQRLSVQPVAAAEWQTIMALSARRPSLKEKAQAQAGTKEHG